MRGAIPLVMLGSALVACAATAQEAYQVDTLRTSAGPVDITFIGHGSLMLTWRDTVIHIDPFGKLADYTQFPDADLVLITHEHSDHLDPAALASVRQTGTVVVAPAAAQIEGATVMANGERRTVLGVEIEAVPAYNLVHRRDNGQPFHPKGAGNGYVLTFGETRIYIAGDTEMTPEMKALQGIDVAFLPMNLPYTMTPEMVADAARALRPAIVYPYHYGDTDPARLSALLTGEGIDVRVRRMQ